MAHAFLLACALVIVQPSTPSEELEKIARSSLDLILKGDYAAVYARFDDKMKAAMPADKLGAAWEAVLTQTGKFQRLNAPTLDTKGDYRVLVFPADFENAKANMIFAFNASGQIAGWAVRPAP
jgi:hypothetical protein